MTGPLQQAWQWFSGNRAAGLLAVAAVLAEPFKWLVRHVQRKVDSGVLDVLRAAGGSSGVGFREDQIAGQSGSDPKKVRASLRRLRKRGQVREAEDRWYVTGTGSGEGGKRRFPW